MNYKEVAEYCKNNWPKESAKVIEVADETMENCFKFDMPWDLERTEEIFKFDGEIDWYFKMNNDPEFLYQLNRHAFLLWLIEAYYLTGEEKYAKKCCELWEDWIDRNPRDDGDTPWRSLEVGIRGELWVKAIEILSSTPFYTDELKEKIKKCLYVHLDILKEAHGPFQHSSNWGIIQDSGMFVIGAFLNEKEYMDLAVQRLMTEASLQIMADGVHWEQSCGYHNAVLFCFLSVFKAAKDHGYELPKSFLETIEKAAFVNVKWIKPNGHHLLLGDSDDNDIRDLLCRCAMLLRKPEFKALAFKTLDYDNAWLFGMEGVEEFKKLPAKLPDFKNAYLEDSGNYILRTGWDEKANHLAFYNGYTGGGHSHADKLHFALTLSGRDVLVDAGRYTYKNVWERHKIKDASSHNTTIVGDTSFCEAVDSWAVVNPALAVPNPVFENENCVLIGGGHLGYLTSNGVYCHRRILWIKPDIYVVLDSYRGENPNKFTQYYHFSYKGDVQLNGNTATYTDDVGSVDLHILKDDASLKIAPSIYSPNYNKLIENKALEVSFQSEKGAFSAAVIHENKADDNITVEGVGAFSIAGNKPINKSDAEGIVIKTKDAEYTVCIGHVEIKSTFLCNGKMATGRLVVYKDDKVIFKRW